MRLHYKCQRFNTLGWVSLFLLLQACHTKSDIQDTAIPAAIPSIAKQELYFHSPAIVDIDPNADNDQGTRGIQFMGQALPLGNGRLGAMFAGGVEQEYIVFNDITLWMNGSRGLGKIEQSGAQAGAYKNLDIVRKAARDRKFGTGEDSVESLGTQYIATKQRLGNYAPFADLKISTGHNLADVTNYRRSLDISSGLGAVSYDLNGVKYSREYFCSYPDDLCAIRLTADGGTMDITLDAVTVHDKHTITAKGDELALLGYAPMQQGDDIAFLQSVKVTAKNAKITAISNSLSVQDAKVIDIYVTGYTDYLAVYPEFNGRDYTGDTAATLGNAIAIGYDRLKQQHVKDVNALMGRVTLDLNVPPSTLPTNQLMEHANPLEVHKLYFDYARYLHISSSRDAPVPSNLQGLWNTLEAPPWNSDYHTDINVQMNYWMAETTHLPETFAPFVNWTKLIAESGQYTAKETFGVDKGWNIGLNGNVFGFTAQNFHGRRMQQGSHWVAQHLFEHYAFNKDTDYLKDIYPVLKGACEFFTGHLASWQDGTLLVYPTWSPENFLLPEQYGELNKQAWGASYDQQLLVNLFTDCIEASLVLGKDEVFRQDLKRLIPRLTPQKINQHGMIQEWPEDFDEPDNTHRHLSHLFALHPGRDISIFTLPELNAASEKVMKQRVQRWGWSGAWRASLWARLRNGEQALQYYHEVAFGKAFVNLLNGEPWQIDGNLGAAAAVSEMLLQSHLRSINPNAKTIEQAAFVAYAKDPTQPNHFIGVVPADTIKAAPYIIDLLPALPAKWADGSVSGLKARGGFVVDITWAEQKLKYAKIRATKNQSFRVFANGKLSETLSLKAGESFNWQK